MNEYFKSVLEFQDNFKREGLINRYVTDSKWYWRNANQLNNESVEFVFPPTVYNRMSDLREIRARYQINLVKGDDNAPLDPDDVVSVINHAAANIVDNVHIMFNDTTVEKCSKNHLKVFIQDHFSLSTEDRDRSLKHEGYYDMGENNGKVIPENAMDVFDCFRERASFFGEAFLDGGKWQVKYEKNYFEIEVTYQFGISESKLPLVPGLPMTIHLGFVKPNFFLEAHPKEGVNYKFEVTSASMGVMQRTYTDAMIKSVEKMLENGITYRFPYYALKELNMERGSASLLNKTFLNYYAVNPVRFYVFFILDSLARPKLDRPQHYFKLFFPGEGGNENETEMTTMDSHLASFNIKVNGDPLLLSKKMNPRSLQLYLYKESMEALKKKFGFKAYPMSVEDWATKGYALICVDNSKTNYPTNDGSIRQPSRDGHVELDADFTKQLGFPVRCQILSEYHCQVIVDKNRKAYRKEVVADDA